MSRRIEARYTIKAQMETLAPIHVGGKDRSSFADLTLARNGKGEYYLSGTTIAGTLRVHYQSIFGEEATRDVWGYQQGLDGNVSQLSVYDSIINLPESVSIEVRDGVAIDRNTGTAAFGYKYDIAIIPTGASFEISLELEKGLQDPKVDLNTIDNIVAILRSENLRFGAAQTRGFGLVQIKKLQVTVDELTDKSSLLATLRKQTRELDVTKKSTQRPTLNIQIEWEPLGPVMVKREVQGLTFDGVPLTSRRSGKEVFVIPGASLKGCFRSRAENIIRTLLQQGGSPSENFAKQIDVCLVNEVFGSSKNNDARSSGRRGALFFRDCYSTTSLPENLIQDLLFSESDAETINTTPKALRPHLHHTYHVAIDRWTGGAADGMLYSILEPVDLSWEPIKLSLDLNWLRQPSSQDQRMPAVALLLLLLRDFSNKRIPIGFATTRGMGFVKVNNIKISTLGAGDEFNSITNSVLKGGDLSSISSGFLKDLSSIWLEWITTARKNLVGVPHV